MQLDLNNPPSDTALLHRLVREMAVVVDSRDGEIERLQLIIRKLQRAQSGVVPNARLVSSEFRRAELNYLGRGDNRDSAPGTGECDSIRNIRNRQF